MQIEISETLARELHDILDSYYNNCVFDLSYEMCDFLHDLREASSKI